MESISLTSVAKSLGYTGIVEEVYKSNHPDVIKWTKYFHDLICKRKIFENLSDLLPADVLTARIVATGWHAFSDFMPWFLCQAASMVSNNLTRHYVIQTVFEELGMRDYRQIHADMFWSAAQSIGINSHENFILKEDGELKKSLNYLKSRLLSYSYDMQIMGILLGLEMPAIENIETIYSGMSYDNESALILENSLFFKIHREVEVEHVRLTVSNFLRFKKSNQDTNDFINGFQDGVCFWNKFWCGIKNYILLLKTS